MTQQEQREYEWESGSVLLDESATAYDLMRHNSNVQVAATRSRDEAIHDMVRGLADKLRNNQDTSGRFTFAMRLHARHYPPRLRNASAQFLMTKYEE